MSNLVIVTKHCYLICESIRYIVINDMEDNKTMRISDDFDDDDDTPKKAVKLTKRQKQQEQRHKRWMQVRRYRIIIEYNPVGRPGQQISQGEYARFSFDVAGKSECLAVFQDMVMQIREQMPDQVYLDKLVDKMFCGSSVTK